MSRGKVGTKTGREDRNRAFQDGLRARKKLRHRRRHEHGMLNAQELRDRDSREPIIAVVKVTIDGVEQRVAVHPSEQDWADVVETARRRKRSIKTFVQKAGWTLTGDDPKNREHWTAY